MTNDVAVELEAIVTNAMVAAFGSERIDGITPIVGGASGAFPFRVDMSGNRYLVRVEGPASPLRNPHQYESMRIAAEAGIAPRLYHVNEVARVAVMDFVAERPLTDYHGGSKALAQAIGTMLTRIESTPFFPFFVEYPHIVGRLWAWVCQTGLFAPGVLDGHSERLEEIRRSYLWDPAHAVSCHNDLVPRNVLYDGARLWLVDWESAYRNDPLVDVAIALDNFAPEPNAEAAMLEAWYGRSPGEQLLAQLAPVRALTRLYYAGVFLSASFAASGALGDQNISGPSVTEFRDALRKGRLVPGTPAAKHALGKMYLASFMTGAVPPGLALDHLIPTCSDADSACGIR